MLHHMKLEPIEEDVPLLPPSEQWEKVLEEIKRKETRNYFEEVIEENLYPLQRNVELLLKQRPDLYLVEVKDLLAQAFLVVNGGRVMDESDPRYEALKNRLNEILAAMKDHIDASGILDKQAILKLIYERHGMNEPDFKPDKQFPRGDFTYINPDEGREHPTIH